MNRNVSWGKTERLSVSIPENIIKKVREQAIKEQRTISNMVSIMLEKAAK